VDGFFNKDCVISDTLVEDLQNQELVLAVVRHEMGHSKMNHVIKNFLLKCLFYSSVFVLIAICCKHYENFVLVAFGIEYKSMYLAIFLFGNFALSVPLYLFEMLENIIQRQ
jgi:Zn-dependent protease with chaperone function